MIKEKLLTTEESLRKAEFIEANMELSSMHLHYHFLWDLITLIPKKEVTYLEVGCFAGGSCSLAASHWKPTKCFSIDLGYHEFLPEGYLDSAERNIAKFKNPSSSFQIIKGDSHSDQIIDLVKEKLSDSGELVDILFIDGDHEYDGVISDFIFYSPLVCSGGYIIFDDYLDWKYSPQVKHAVDNIVNNMIAETYEIIGTPDDKFKARVGYPLPGGKNNCFVIKKR